MENVIFLRVNYCEDKIQYQEKDCGLLDSK